MLIQYVLISYEDYFSPFLAVVHRIRHAPSPSTFTLLEDEELRSHIVSLLRKKERRAAERARKASTGSENSVVETVSVKNRRKISSSSTGEGTIDGERRKKKLEK